MGLNMPARTVLFTSARKFDGHDFRWVSYRPSYLAFSLMLPIWLACITFVRCLKFILEKYSFCHTDTVLPLEDEENDVTEINYDNYMQLFIFRSCISKTKFTSMPYQDAGIVHFCLYFIFRWHRESTFRWVVGLGDVVLMTEELLYLW